MAKKRIKPSKEQKLQAQVQKLTRELAAVNHINKNLTEQVTRSELRANDHRNAILAKEAQFAVLSDKHLAVVAERERMIRMVDQFTSINISSPTAESRALRNTKMGL